MATKNKGKGNIGAVEISSVYTAIPQLISLDKSGEVSEVYDARTIDGNVHHDRPNNGYVSNPTYKMEAFWDSANAVHAFLITSMRAPPAAGVNFKHTDTAGTPVVEIWNITGIGVDQKIETNSGIKGTITLETSGNPS